MKLGIRLGMAAYAALLFTATQADAGLYVFGDSLSDAGNVWDASKNTPDRNDRTGKKQAGAGHRLG